MSVQIQSPKKGEIFRCKADDDVDLVTGFHGNNVGCIKTHSTR